MGLGARSAVAVVALLAASLLSSRAEAETPPPADEGYAGVRHHVDRLSDALGLNVHDRRVLRGLFLLQARSESGGNNLAANKSDSERAASKALYYARGNSLKLADALGPQVAPEWYTPGSAGWFGLMPTTLINLVLGKDARGLGLGPRSNLDPWTSVLMYAVYLDRLRRRKEWADSSRDVYALKAGGAAGSLMDDPHKARYKTAAKHVDEGATALGLGASFGSERINASAIFGGRDWLAIWKAGRPAP